MTGDATSHDSEPYVCAVDVGTSAARAAVVGVDGTVVASARIERGVAAATFDAVALWADVAQVLREVCRRQDAPHAIAAVGVAAHVGAVLVDESGVAVQGCAISWSDVRGTDLVAAAWAGTDRSRRAGRPVVTGGAVPFLAWLRQHRPEQHERVRGVLAPKDYLLLHLTGRPVTDVTSAAYSLGFDVRSRTWSAELLEIAGVDQSAMPRAYPAVTLIGEVSARAAQETGLPAGTPVVAGGPDGTVGAAAVIGTRQAVVVDVAGTTDVLTSLSDVPPAGSDSVVNPYLVDGLWSHGGPTGMTGGAMDHLAGLLGLGTLGDAMRRYGAEMAELPPGAEGLRVVPLLTGSRFPDWRPEERAALWGLSDGHGPTHVLRAAQEAAAFVVRGAVERLGLRGGVVLAGGAARSEALAQLRADALDRPVYACAEPDVSLLGAAMLGFVGAGIHPDLAGAVTAMTPGLRAYEPSPERADRYTELYASWEATRMALRAGPTT